MTAPATPLSQRQWPAPKRPWVIGQEWSNLLFAHWPFPVHTLAPLIPEGLALDLWEGAAWVSVVPFHAIIHPRFVPSALGQRFLEVNVRTYVTRGGNPTVKELRDACTARRYTFSAVTDHSYGLKIAGGMTMEEAAAQRAEILKVNRDYVIKALLHGVTGPVGGRTFTEVMVPMGIQKDDWIAAIGSYIRNDFDTSSMITPADVARVRLATANRRTSWTVPEIERSLPTLMQAQPTWTLTASHNATAVARALTLAGWSSAAPQAAGMWFQIDLPEAVLVSELQFDAAATGRGGGGGGRGAAAGAGRGGAGAPAPAGVASPVPARGVVQAPAPAIGFPREYQVQVSTDGKTWSAPVARGTGRALTVVSFAPVRARSIRITQTATTTGDAPAWSIQNLRVYATSAASASR